MATAGDALVDLAWDPPASDSGITRHEFRYKTDGSYLRNLDRDCGQRGRRGQRGRVHGDGADQRHGLHVRAARGGRRRRWRGLTEQGPVTPMAPSGMCMDNDINLALGIGRFPKAESGSATTPERRGVCDDGFDSDHHPEHVDRGSAFAGVTYAASWAMQPVRQRQARHSAEGARGLLAGRRGVHRHRSQSRGLLARRLGSGELCPHRERGRPVHGGRIGSDGHARRRPDGPCLGRPGQRCRDHAPRGPLQDGGRELSRGVDAYPRRARRTGRTRRATR